MTKRSAIIITLWLAATGVLLVLPSAAQQAAFPHLKVTLSPPRLPADAGTYAAIYVQVESSTGKVIAAPRDILVSLTSSVLQVASADPVLTIPRGLTYAVASLSTTATQGTTNITAAAPGFAPSSVLVATVAPSGTAVKLGVFLAPQTLLPQAATSSRVIVQLQDAGGKPARASSDAVVALASSQIKVANVTASITIRKSSTYGIAAATVSFAPGVTTITASASGLVSGFGQLSVVGPSASKLSVNVSPGNMAAGTSERALVAVQLEGSDGTPTPASTPLVVQLTSSNTNVGVITNGTITIQSGQSWATSAFIALNKGKSTVTASAQGVATGSFLVMVSPFISAGNGQVSISLATPTILPDRGRYASIVVQLTNGTFPMVINADTNVFLASSNTNIGSVQSSLLIPRGSSFGVAAFTSTLAVGSTTLTASASNFASTSMGLSSAGPVPNKLTVVLGTSLLVANGEAYTTTAVQLQDPNGNPAKAPDDIIVTLASADPDVGDVSHSVLISSGTTYGFVVFHSTLTPGSTQITASAPGYVSGQSSIATAPPSEFALAVYEAPANVPADGASHASLIVQVQDAAGLPVKADLPVDVILSSSDPTRVDLPPNLQIPAGASYAIAQVRSSTINGSVIVTAQAQGLGSASFAFKTSLLNMLASVRVSGQSPAITLTTIKMVANVSSGGYPLPGAKVQWSTSEPFLKLVNSTQTTDSAGQATAYFFVSAQGNGSITIITSKGGFASQTITQLIIAKARAISVVLVPTLTITNASVPTNILALVTSEGKPLSNASILWSTSLGSLNPIITLTDKTGSSTVSFFASSPGTATISVQVTAPGYSTAGQTVMINVGGRSGPLGLGGLLDLLLMFSPYIAVIVFVVIAIVALARRRRSRTSLSEKGKEEEETEEAE